MIPYDSQIARLSKRKLFPQRSAAKKWIWIGAFAGLLLLSLRILGRAQDSAVANAAIGILEAKCALCHGSSKMSGLDMRDREALLKGGTRGPAIVPGKAEESLLYRAAAHQGELKMPPGSSVALPDDELAVLKRWINDSADWPQKRAAVQTTIEPSWWSLKKLRRPPSTSTRSSQCESDRFIHSRQTPRERSTTCSQG
jgi:Planctomycete cytochrome C